MSFILTETENSVLKIKLNRPDKFNSFNREMALQLQEVLKKGAADKSIRAVYLTGEGKAFCAGQDLAEALDPNGPGIKKIVEEHYNPIVSLIRSIEKPVVCGVNGVAAGAGANIALACDIVIAAENASFIQAFSKIGLIPDSGGTFFLPRLVGFQRATAMMMLGDKITAQEAFTFGMLYKVVGLLSDLDNTAMEVANTLAAMPTKAMGLTKRLLNESMTNTIEQQLKREGEVQVEAAATFDYNEGVSAFLEKRKPAFKGE